MKKLKGFVWQREKSKGFMEEAYIVYESFYYNSEYIKKMMTHLAQWFGMTNKMRTNEKGSYYKQTKKVHNKE
jgi:hypothetical protein